MIRTTIFKSNYIPQKLINPLREKSRMNIAYCRFIEWDQIVVEDEELKKWCHKVAGLKTDKESLSKSSVVFHTIFGGISTHRDSDNKSCKIIPLKTGNKTELYVDGQSFYSCKKLEKYKVYTFNDYNNHGLNNIGKCELISIG
jgi:hypothetical protein